MGDVDNCPTVWNQTQLDSDSGGNECDTCTDQDEDTWGTEPFDKSGCSGSTEEYDNCSDTCNPGQDDTDSDGYGDACDTCIDTDSDGYGDPGFDDITGCTSTENCDNCWPDSRLTGPL